MKRVGLFMLLLLSGGVARADVFVEIADYGQVIVDWENQECAIENPDWDNDAYEVSIRKLPFGSWSEPEYAPLGTVGGMVFPADMFIKGKTYKAKVKYFGTRGKCRGVDRPRLVGTKKFVYDFELNHVKPPPHIEDDWVRIKNISFSKCVYPYGPGPVDNLRAHNWGCWGDSTMAFSVIDTSVVGEVRLRSEATGRCLRTLSSINYGEVGFGGCYGDDTLFVLQPTGGLGQFRMKNKGNGMCLYGSPDNGGFVRQFGCWANPDMVFKFEDY